MVSRDEWSLVFEKMSFCEKVAFTRRVMEATHNNYIGYDLSSLYWNGYLKKTDKYCVLGSGGTYYVYLWRHAWGEPFYVGCGRGDRWTVKSPRCDDFYSHLDKADAVVYKVLDGVDSHTARMFEKYISVNLVEAGYALVNGDNNPSRMSEEKRIRAVESCVEIGELELSSLVQKATIDILKDEPKCDYRVTKEFIDRNGSDCFSRNFKKG